MSKISIPTYFFSILLLFCVYFLVKDIHIGLTYLLFTVVAIVGTRLFTSNFYRSVYIIIVLSITAGYFIRPLILVDYPDLFMYSKLTASADIETIRRSLYFSLINFILLSAAFIITIKI